MFARFFSFLAAAGLVAAVAVTYPPVAPADVRDGVIRVKSSYSMAETVERLKKDIADKQLMMIRHFSRRQACAIFPHEAALPSQRRS